MSYSNDNSYQRILNRCLSNPLLSDKDKRQGSIIYDTIAPLCLELAEAYIKMEILESQTYLMTALGSNLDKKAYDFGVTRELATKAKVIVKFYTYEKNENNQIIYYDDNDNVTTKDLGLPKLIEMSVPLNTRFVLASDTSLVYKYIQDIDDNKIAECETYGTIGNSIGLIVPMTPINNLVEARIESSYILAQNEEDDDTFRIRARETILSQGYGGNVDDYVSKLNAYTGISQTKVFPVWNGGGSVLLSIVGEDSNTFNPIDDTFKNEIQQYVDPTQDGYGIGIAPIGHRVTITTPQNYNVDVSVSVQLNSNYQLNGLQIIIQDKIREYFYEERKKFKQNYNLTIYRSEINSRVLSVPGVINVTSILLNGMDSDITNELIDQPTLNGQKLPSAGTITITES